MEHRGMAMLINITVITYTGEEVVCECSVLSKVHDLKVRISEVTSVPLRFMKLLFSKGEDLNDNQILKSYHEFTDGSREVYMYDARVLDPDYEYKGLRESTFEQTKIPEKQLFSDFDYLNETHRNNLTEYNMAINNNMQAIENIYHCLGRKRESLNASFLSDRKLKSHVSGVWNSFKREFKTWSQSDLEFLSSLESVFQELDSVKIDPVFGNRTLLEYLNPERTLKQRNEIREGYSRIEEKIRLFDQKFDTFQESVDSDIQDISNNLQTLSSYQGFEEQVTQLRQRLESNKQRSDILARASTPSEIRNFIHESTVIRQEIEHLFEEIHDFDLKFSEKMRSIFMQLSNISRQHQEYRKKHKDIYNLYEKNHYKMSRLRYLRDWVPEYHDSVVEIMRRRHWDRDLMEYLQEMDRDIKNKVNEEREKREDFNSTHLPMKSGLFRGFEQHLPYPIIYLEDLDLHLPNIQNNSSELGLSTFKKLPKYLLKSKQDFDLNSPTGSEILSELHEQIKDLKLSNLELSTNTVPQSSFEEMRKSLNKELEEFKKKTIQQEELVNSLQSELAEVQRSNSHFHSQSLEDSLSSLYTSLIIYF
eukprot:TRINITY_DN5520_c0_g1_i2.p1 TRINITY_DN5520_c0_g1~~TRINITY_DN5520_c0_g1_i2.p1  ORF type:complete len:590 (-),score=98.49 TRINITY_DN5520_c0_g1_i2:317-2086(-)